MADANSLFGNNRGIFATILKMKLRKSNETGECIDFLRFKRNNDLASERICGDYEASGGYTSDQTKFFADDSGRLKIHIEFDQSVPMKNTDTFEMMLVLTAYRKSECCRVSFHPDDYVHTFLYFPIVFSQVVILSTMKMSFSVRPAYAFRENSLMMVLSIVRHRFVQTRKNVYNRFRCQ